MTNIQSLFLPLHPSGLLYLLSLQHLRDPGVDKEKADCDHSAKMHCSHKQVSKCSPCVQEVQGDLALQRPHVVPVKLNRKKVTKMMMKIGKDIKEDCDFYHFSRFSVVSFRPWHTIYPLNIGKMVTKLW